MNGKGTVSRKLYGGCLDSLYDIYTSERYGNENEIYTKYNVLPTLEEWKEKILFIETSEERMQPDKLEKVLNYFKDNKILETVKGVIVGKPIDEKYRIYLNLKKEQKAEFIEKFAKICEDNNIPCNFKFSKYDARLDVIVILSNEVEMEKYLEYIE